MTAPQRKRDWESQFETWAQPPSRTEQEKCDRAVRAVKNAIDDSQDLAGRSIEIFPQGSYANRLNVPGDSDVDVCNLYSDTIFFDLPEGMTPDQVGISVPATYQYGRYKDEVEAALVGRFGRQNVVRGTKAFDIHENTYRVDADAVACFEFRQYYFDIFGQVQFHKGTALVTDREGSLVTNFPKQQYANGVAKNDATGRRYKALVRILKCLRNEIDGAGIETAAPISSFLVESLVYNVLNDRFQHPTYFEDALAVLAFLYAGTDDDASCGSWTESNGLKSLFGQQQEWKRQQVRDFVAAAYVYITTN